ncbi:MAG: hypothetical protein ACI920_002822, partial [Saprospiraceae bacterium]
MEGGYFELHRYFSFCESIKILRAACGNAGVTLREENDFLPSKIPLSQRALALFIRKNQIIPRLQIHRHILHQL